MKKLKKIISVLLTTGMILGFSIEAQAYTYSYEIAIPMPEYGEDAYRYETVTVDDPYEETGIRHHFNTETHMVERCTDELVYYPEYDDYLYECTYCHDLAYMLHKGDGVLYAQGIDYYRYTLCDTYNDDQYLYIISNDTDTKKLTTDEKTVRKKYEYYNIRHVVFDMDGNYIRTEKCEGSNAGTTLNIDDDSIWEFCLCGNALKCDMKYASGTVGTYTFIKNKTYSCVITPSTIENTFNKMKKTFFTESGIKSVSAKASKAEALTSFKWNSKTGKATFKLKQKCTVTLTVTTNLGGKAVMKYKFK